MITIRPLRNLLALVSLALGTVPSLAQLTINHGVAGLKTSAGSTNHVWANVPPANTVFDRWTGNTSVLADPLDWHTTAVVPSSATSVTATFKAAPAWTTLTWIVNGKASTDPAAVRLMYYSPANPVGVIFFFHGKGGSAAAFYSTVETVSFAREAVAAGYLIASLDSNNRTSKDWNTDTSANNVDVKNVQAATDYLISRGLITSATPKYSTGMSGGGAFSPKPAYYQGFKANAIWCAAGSPLPLFKTTTVPTIWCLAQNDDLYLHTTNLAYATQNLANLTKRGIDGQLSENPPSPVYPQRFMRIPGLTISDSQTIFNILKNGGYLNADNFLNSDPTTSGWRNAMPTYLKRYYNAIQDQLDSCYSGHKFFSDYDSKVLAFFNAHR